MSLQNHLGDAEFPVRARSRYTRSIDAWRRQHPKANSARALLITAIGVAGGAIALIVALVVLPEGRMRDDAYVFGVGGFVVALITGSIVLARRDAGAPRRAQREYLAATGAAPTTLDQQQILALDAASDYSFGGWNSSLAFAFAWVELPQAVRTKWNDGQKGTPWPVLPNNPLVQLRTALDREFKIASGTDAEVLVADLLDKGRLSARFEEVAASNEAEVMASRVAAIAGVTVFDVIELSAATGDRPPELLLAGDVERVVGAVRYTYMAGYLSAARAWELLARVAEKAFERYDSYEQYWKAVTVATAFRTDSLEAVENYRAHLAGLREHGWPAASTPFPRRSPLESGRS